MQLHFKIQPTMLCSRFYQALSIGYVDCTLRHNNFYNFSNAFMLFYNLHNEKRELNISQANVFQLHNKLHLSDFQSLKGRK